MLNRYGRVVLAVLAATVITGAVFAAGRAPAGSSDTPWLVTSALGASLMLTGLAGIAVARHRRPTAVVAVPRAGQPGRPTVTDIGPTPTMTVRWEPRADAGTQRLVELAP